VTRLQTISNFHHQYQKVSDFTGYKGFHILLMLSDHMLFSIEKNSLNRSWCTRCRTIYWM